MTPEFVLLAQRVVSCSKWRWMPGMLAQRTIHSSIQERGRPQTVPVRFTEGLQFGGRTGAGEPIELADPCVVELTPSGECLVASAHASVDGWHRVANLLPDLTDPATLGCLLVLVREAWNDYTITTQFHPSAGASDRNRWRVWQPGNPIAYGVSEPEALVSALEQSLFRSK